MKLGIIGAGNLGMAIAKNAARKVEVVAVKRKVVDTKNIDGIEITDDIEALEDCDILFVTLKPEVFRIELKKIGNLAKKIPVVSFAAGVKMEEMKKHIVNPYRAMTNLAIESRSLIAYYPPDAINHISFLDAEFIKCESERELEVMTSYIGSSPGILAYLLHAFYISAVKDGVEHKKATKIAISAFKSTAMLYERYGLENMVAKIATPGGTTVEGIVEVMEAQEIIVKALSAATSKAKVL